MTVISSPLGDALRDRYLLERELGAGGMATVYLARDLKHDRKVAIKVLRPELGASLGPERFLQEIRVAAKLQHPHIVGLLDSGVITSGPGPEVLPYYVMPFVEGETLRERLLRTGPLTVSEVVRLTGEIADALAKAHKAGVVHRDIKPENILLADGHALVMDFGVAKAVSDATGRQGLTSAGMSLGTPAYMAPEQVAADPRIDHRADLYALGLVAYEMLAGGPPYSATIPQQQMAAHLTQAPTPIHLKRPDCPPALAALVMRCLSKHPDERWQTAEDVVSRIGAIETMIPHRVSRWTLRRIGVLVGAVVLVVGGAYVALRGRVRVPPVPREEAAVGGAGQSVAVLPFVNIGGRSEEEYFADGMTEELINALGRVEGMRVVGRASAFALKGSTATEGEIGERLHVATVLTGSVRRSGGRLRVSAQLVSAKDGFQLWSDTYDRAVRDAFTVQDEITGAIVAALRGPLGSGQLARLRGPRTESSEAHDLVLKARFHFNRLTEADLRTSLALYQRALQHDPGYAAAWAGISLVWAWLADDWLPPREAYPRAEAAARRALQLDSTLAEAHEELGIVQYVYHWDFGSSERAFRRALALNHNRAHAYYSLAEQLGMTDGQADSAITLFRRAKQLEPLAPLIPSRLGDLLSDLGRWDEAADEYRQALDLEPSFSRALRGHAATLLARGRGEEALALLRRAPETGVMIGAEIARTEAQLGRAEEARRTAHELEEESRRRYVDPTQIAEIYTALGNRDSAFVWLERAYEARAARLTWLQSEFRFAPLRADPRFAALARRVGLPQWRRD